MKRLFVVTVVSFLVISCNSQIPTKKKTDLTSVKSSMLWKIEGNHLKNPAYLFGSMHIVQKRFFHFSDTLKNLILNSDQVIMELGDMPDYSSILPKLMLPEGEVLDTYFRPAQLDSLLDFMEKNLSIPRTMYSATFSKMKPFVLMQLILAKQFEGETESYDMHIMNLAKENKIPIVGLETVEQQLAFFDSIPTKSLINEICVSTQNMDSIQKATIQLQEVYAKGNLDSLAVLMKDTSSILSEFQSILLDNRNINWAEQLKSLLKGKKTFIAVGAGHLTGKSGLIELLRSQGYTVMPIRY
jgi:uncharacterized protein YbaP (TraB family)